ncbi:MAG: phage tail tape measure protein [Chthoniobacterales bacterium]|nr:phage tail tape measure protein [Chthoniobacterales bacterium]
MTTPYKRVVELVIDANNFFRSSRQIASEFDRDMKALAGLAVDQFRQQAKDQREIAKELHRFRIQAMREEVAAVRAAAQDQLAFNKAMAKDERSIAVALNQYRREAAKERMAAERASAQEARAIDVALHQYRLQAEREEAREKISIRRAVHQQVLALQREEVAAARAAAQEKRVAQGSGLQLGSGLNIGAGMLGMMNQFQGAAALYTLSRISSVAGVATLSLTALAPAMAAIGIIAAGVAAPLATMAAALDFQQQIAQMGTLLESTRVSAQQFTEDLTAMSRQVADVSVKFNTDLIDTVHAFKEALSSGIEQDEMSHFMDAAGTLSNSLQVNLTKATDMLTSFKDAYGLKVNELAHLNDVLFQSINVGKFSVNQLAGSIGRLLPIASAAGMSIEDMMGGLAALTRQGFSTSQAVTSMAQVIGKIVKPGEAARAEFNRLGITFGQAALHGKPFIQFLEELRTKTSGSLDVFSTLFPEERAKRGAAALAATNEQLQLVRTSIAEIKDSWGLAEEAADRAMNNWKDNGGKLAKAVANEFILAGDVMLNAMQRIFFGDGPISESTLLNVQLNVAEIGRAFMGILVAVQYVGQAVVTGLTPVRVVLHEITTGVQAASQVMKGEFSLAAKTMFNGALESAKMFATAIPDALNNIKQIGVEGGRAVDEQNARIAELKQRIETAGLAAAHAKTSHAKHAEELRATQDAADRASMSLDAMGEAEAGVGRKAEAAGKETNKWLNDFDQDIAKASTALESFRNSTADKAMNDSEKERVRLIREELLPLKREEAELQRAAAEKAAQKNWLSFEEMKTEQMNLVVMMDTYDLQGRILTGEQELAKLQKDAVARMSILGKTGQEYDRSIVNAAKEVSNVLHGIADISTLSIDTIQKVVAQTKQLASIKEEILELEKAISLVPQMRFDTERERAQYLVALIKRLQELQKTEKTLQTSRDELYKRDTVQFQEAERKKTEALAARHKAEMLALAEEERKKDEAFQAEIARREELYAKSGGVTASVGGGITTSSNLGVGIVSSSSLTQSGLTRSAPQAPSSTLNNNVSLNVPINVNSTTASISEDTINKTVAEVRRKLEATARNQTAPSSYNG